MSITLNSEQEALVVNLIETGGFQTAEEVLQVALNRLATEWQSYQAWIVDTQEQVREGIASLDRGEGVNGETAVNDLLAKLRRSPSIEQTL
jgi:antitoxin ParD1/3/4